MTPPPRERPTAMPLTAGVGRGPSTWVLRHLQALFYSLGQLFRAPVATLMTAGVVGISLALPALLFVLLDNVQRLGQSWEGAAEISVYLSPAADDATARRVAAELRERPELEEIRVMTRAESLAEFRKRSGLGAVLEVFEDDNPLPAVLILRPRPRFASPESLSRVAADIQRRPEVDFAEFDRQWLMRLQAFTEIFRRGVLVLAAVLALGVLLIVGNTIRLEIENRREEIEIQKLCGATDRFVRRPFLYAGVWYGFAGGLLAWLIMSAAIGLLRGPVERLATLYLARFELLSLTPGGAATVFAVGAALGLAGSWLAVGRHLSAIQPS